MLRLNLGCSDAAQPGFINVDRWTPPWATADNFQQADLDGPWPWADNSVDEIRAHDVIEHLRDKIHTMNEIHRVLKPDGTVDIVVPTTDGRGAFQDPTHVSYWNRNSFFYHEAGNPHFNRFKEAYQMRAEFRVAFERDLPLQDAVTKLHIVLEAVKPLLVSNEALSAFNISLPPGVPMQSDRPAFSIIHTSARPHEWRKVYDAWLASAAHPESVEYVLCVDSRWGFVGADALVNDTPALVAGPEPWGLRPQDKVIWNTGRRCYVDGVNLAAAASSGDVLIVNADDQYPCDKWDEKIDDAWEAASPNKMVDDFVIEVSTNTPTEHERSIMVMPILSRERYERFGWVFYPEYESMFADNDFCQMAKRDKCIIDARHLVFPHKHWINGQREKDEQDRAQNRQEAYDEGAKLFAARKRIGFAGIPPTVTAPAQALDSKIPMVAFVTPGSVFPAPWLAAWTNLWGYLASGNRYNVTHLVGYTSNAGMVRTALARLVMTTDYGVPVDFVMWLDDDNTITPEQFEMLVQDLREHPEYDMVCGWTWCAKDDDPEVGRATISCGWLKDLETTPDGQDVKFTKIKQISPKEMYESQTDLIEIGYSGFPAVLMRAELLKKAGRELFNPYVDPRCEYGFSGEDVAFFARATIKSGARYAVDRRVKVPHYKRRAVEPVPTNEQVEEARRLTAQLAAKY